MSHQTSCHLCGGTMEPGFTVVYQHHDGLVFEHVPALVCRQCGEATISGATFELLDRITEERPAPTHTRPLRVYELALEQEPSLATLPPATAAIVSAPTEASAAD